MNDHAVLRHHAAPGPMTPGKYICMRRGAAGLDQVDVAIAIASPTLDAEEAGVRLMRLEADQLTFDLPAVRLIRPAPDQPAFNRPIEHVAFIDALEQVIRFDPAVYWALVQSRTDPQTIIPPICRECACTFFDPCSDETGACSWANAGSGEEPLCTHCKPSPAKAEATSRPEPVHAA